MRKLGMEGRKAKVKDEHNGRHTPLGGDEGEDHRGGRQNLDVILIKEIKITIMMIINGSVGK